ncbi:MAG: extracellular solute-binding protein, partial [Gammaproteobacteria bacterium]
MKRLAMLVLKGAICLAVMTSSALAQNLPGATVEERAINGAKRYIEENGLENPSLTMLLISLFKNAMPAYADRWQDLTGVELKFVEYGYTDIPSKIMAEAVAKTGQYDIFNQFPYVVPDAVGAGVLMPLDDLIAKGQPDFSGIQPPLRALQYYNGKQYFVILDGDHLILVLRRDILDLPGVKE